MLVTLDFVFKSREGISYKLIHKQRGVKAVRKGAMWQEHSRKRDPGTEGLVQGDTAHLCVVLG